MVNMFILLVGHQLTDLCTNNFCLKHGLYLLRIIFRLTLIWVGFLGVRFARVRVGKITSLLKLVRIILETWNLVRTYTHISSFKKVSFNTRNTLILLMSAFFGKNSTFIQSNSMRTVKQVF